MSGGNSACAWLHVLVHDRQIEEQVKRQTLQGLYPPGTCCLLVWHFLWEVGAPADIWSFRRGLAASSGGFVLWSRLAWGVSEWGSCHWSGWSRDGLEYGLSVLRMIIWTLRIWVAGRWVTVWKSAAGHGFVSGKNKETWEAVRHWGQEELPAQFEFHGRCTFPVCVLLQPKRMTKFLEQIICNGAKGNKAV